MQLEIAHLEQTLECQPQQSCLPVSSAQNAPSESLFLNVRHQEVPLEASFLLKGKFRQESKREGKNRKNEMERKNECKENKPSAIV